MVMVGHMPINVILLRPIDLGFLEGSHLGSRHLVVYFFLQKIYPRYPFEFYPDRLGNMEPPYLHLGV